MSRQHLCSQGYEPPFCRGTTLKVEEPVMERGRRMYEQGGTAGLLLAAGTGRRYGRPKILVPGWLEHSIVALRGGGCDSVHVVTGAARPYLPDGALEIYCEDWDKGIGASLYRGLAELGAGPERVLIHLIDYPDIGSAVVERVLQSSGGQLARAVFNGRPGHPVNVPRRHIPSVMGSLRDGDGAGPYLREHSAVTVECGDLASGQDADTQEAAGRLMRNPPAAGKGDAASGPVK